MTSQAAQSPAARQAGASSRAGTLPPRRASSVAGKVPESQHKTTPRTAAHANDGDGAGSSQRQYVLGDRVTHESSSGEAEQPARISHDGTRPVRTGQRAGASETLLTQRSPSLMIETVGPAKIKVGKKSAYKISVTNEGRSPAHDVLLTVEIPAWASVAGAKPTSGAIDTVEAAAGAVEVRWEIPRLETGATEGMLVVVVARESRPLDLAVRWSHAPVATETTIEVQEPKLELSLAGPKEVYYGEKAQYRLTIANPGNGDAENVVVRLLPTTAGEAESEGHPLGTIAAGTSKTVELELIARQAGLVVIRAEATAEGDLRATGGQEVLVRRADVAVDVRGPEFLYAGTTATFEIEVTNPGNATAKDIEIAAILPSGAEYVASDGGGRLSANKDQVLWHMASLQPGSRHIVLLKCRLGRSGQNRMQVTANAEGDLQAAGMTISQVEAVADLKLEVLDPQVPVRVGDRAVYEVRIRNRGSKAAENVDVVAFFSEGVEPVEVEGLPHRIAPGEVTFDTIRSIGPGEQVVLKIEAVADRPGAHIFRAEVRCKALEASLAAEETTRFYKAEQTARRPSGKATSAAPRTLGDTQARRLSTGATNR